MSNENEEAQMRGWKDTNPKDALGIRRAPLSTISGPVLYEIGLAMLEGAYKYGRHNYRVSGVRHSVYFDALMRHMWAWWEGEDIDPKSGLHHLSKAAACIFVMRDSIVKGNDVDDRPPRCDPEFIERMTTMTESLLDRMQNEFGDPKPPYTQKGIYEEE